MPTPSTISRGRSAAQAHPRPRRLSIWRLLLFGDFRQAESHLRATGGSKNEVEAATATGCENGVEGATVPGAVSRTASDSDIELQSPSYPAPKPVLMSQSERKAPSEKQQKRKVGENFRFSPSAFPYAFNPTPIFFILHSPALIFRLTMSDRVLPPY